MGKDQSGITGMKYTKNNKLQPNMLVLIDADILYNRAAFSCETAFSFEGDDVHVSDPANVADLFHRLTMGILHKLDSSRYFMCWSSHENFRTSITDTYKANRVSARRPALDPSFKEHIKGRYPSVQINRLEADDVMGLMSGAFVVIASDDKDMLTIPGYSYKPRRPDDGLLYVSEEDAKYNWYKQILMGDRVDGYNGIPGVGEKKSDKIMADNGATWKTVVDAYEWADLTEEDAIQTAQLARILHPGEWDYNTNEPKLWHP